MKMRRFGYKFKRCRSMPTAVAVFSKRAIGTSQCIIIGVDSGTSWDVRSTCDEGNDCRRNVSIQLNASE